MRHFTPYEQTQLAKHGISADQAESYGQMPVEYITNHVGFNGLDLWVNPDVLIPRVETEELAHRAYQLVCQILASKQNTNNKPGTTLRVLDMGTGCGALAIYLATQLADRPNLPINCQIIASDISHQALAVAQKNAQKHLPSSSRVQLDFKLSNLWSDIKPGLTFDLVVANLPYIPSARIPVLDESVKNFEPWLALDGGSDGLDLIGKMLDQAPAHLTADGTILLEVDYTHDLSAFRPWTSQFEFSSDVDQNLHQRFITAHLR